MTNRRWRQPAAFQSQPRWSELAAPANVRKKLKVKLKATTSVTTSCVVSVSDIYYIHASSSPDEALFKSSVIFAIALV